MLYKDKTILSRASHPIVIEAETTKADLNADRVDSEDEVVNVSFKYEPRIIHPHPMDFENRGCVALARGPFVYCVETIDVNAKKVQDLRTIRLTWDDLSSIKQCADESDFAEWGLKPVTLTVEAYILPVDASQRRGGKLGDRVSLSLIPMFLWANRGKSDLRIWLPVSES